MKAIGVLQWMVLSAAVPLVEEGPFVYLDWQESSNVGGPFQRLYRPSNRVDGPIQSEDFATGLQSLLDTVADAKGTRVQAFGSRWTFNNLAYVQESMVDSTGLNYCQIGMNSSHLTDGFVNLADRLVFVQAGVRIKELNRALTEQNLALSTSGASDGQRVAGAMSTGTHGSRFRYGSMDRMIQAIHIVTDSNQHVLLQGAAVVNQEFASYLGGATLIQDAELFNMAKICFGSCGIIHGYVLEVEPLYFLRYLTRKYSFAEVENTINTLDVSGLDGIKDTFMNPSMIGVGLNLFQTGAGSASVTVYEVTQQQVLQDNRQDNSEGAVSPFLLFLLELVLGVVNKQWVRAIDKTLFGGALVYAVHQIIVTQALMVAQDGDEKIAVDIPSRIFGNPDSESGLEGVYPDIPQYIGKFTNSEMYVPLEQTTDALNIIQRQLRDDPILLLVFLRFVKKSSSTLLSAAIFNTTTAIDMISFQDEGLFSRTSGWFERLFVEFETSGIPHSYHWGKRLPLNNRWVPNAYGEDLTEWQHQRRMLLGGNEAMFRNDAMDQIAVL